MNELKPCPFCGSSEIKLHKHDPYDGYQGDCTMYLVYCRRCGARTEFEDEAILAVKDWNRRST